MIAGWPAAVVTNDRKKNIDFHTEGARSHESVLNKCNHVWTYICTSVFGKIGMPHLFNYRKKGKRQTHTTIVFSICTHLITKRFCFACLHSTDSNGASPLPCECIGMYFKAAGNSGLRLSKLSFAKTSRSTRSSSFLKTKKIEYTHSRSTSEQMANLCKMLLVSFPSPVYCMRNEKCLENVVSKCVTNWKFYVYNICLVFCLLLVWLGSVRFDLPGPVKLVINFSEVKCLV